MNWKKIGNVAVDSGELLIGDPCYFIGKESNSLQRFPSWGDFCIEHPCKEKVHQLTFDGERDGMGVACSTAHGDGFYPVYGLYEDEDGSRPVAMLVITDEIAEEAIELGLELPE